MFYSSFFYPHSLFFWLGILNYVFLSTFIYWIIFIYKIYFSFPLLNSEIFIYFTFFLSIFKERYSVLFIITTMQVFNAYRILYLNFVQDFHWIRNYLLDYRRIFYNCSSLWERNFRHEETWIFIWIHSICSFTFQSLNWVALRADLVYGLILCSFWKKVLHLYPSL